MVQQIQDVQSTSASQQSSQAAVEAAGLPFTNFVWGAGIESSSLPHLNVDQYAWTQHDRLWREDLKRAREELGITALRYHFPWHLCEPQRGQYDWKYADERMAECEKLGLDLFLDVVHFGTPLWLKQAVGDPEFPEALEAYSHALAGRYAGRVRAWCPFNEPLVAALFSGDFGFWPPHARKWRGYMPVLSRIVQGVARSMRAIRRVDPQTPIVLVDNVENYKTRVDSLQIEVRRRNLRRFLALDLLSGRLDRHHPLHAWVTGYGISEMDLEWFRSNVQVPDALGLDYYSHSDWQLDLVGKSVRQRRADTPAGLYGIAQAYYQRYGLPMLLTETSIEGQPINREIWLDTTMEDARRLRSEGVPMLGYFWWPLIDQIDWDGALTHRIGKIHEVGLYSLRRQGDGTLARVATPLIKSFAEAVKLGDQRVGALDEISYPSDELADQGPPIGIEHPNTVAGVAPEAAATLVELPTSGNGNGNGKSATLTARVREADAPGLGGEIGVNRLATQASDAIEVSDTKQTDRYGIVVFCHLRWGFVWQRPQQFLSRFARKHKILFVEEPMFDLREGREPELSLHRVMPNVIVATPHVSQSWNTNPKLPELLRKFTKQAIEDVNEDGTFDRPLLWYYSPMDSAWSLGWFENRGVVYDAMDELSQFTGAPPKLIANEKRLMDHADVLFTGGYELGEKKRQSHRNVHTFGCGVEFEHFSKAMRDDTVIPPDIDFMARPILGWFGVVDERVDYGLLHDIAKLRDHWSIAMVGPVVKVDPNLLPHNPNLFWLGQRDYTVLPNYVKAFDVCIMPFAINAATQYINPTKALEYMATGRPIVSTPVRDVVRQWSDLVYVEKSADDWVNRIEQILAHRDQDRINRQIELARKSSWENTVQTMQDLILDAINQKDRPSATRIEPLSEAELVYSYQATPGS